MDQFRRSHERQLGESKFGDPGIFLERATGKNSCVGKAKILSQGAFEVGSSGDIYFDGNSWALTEAYEEANQ